MNYTVDSVGMADDRRRSGRAPAAPPARQRLASAPVFWKRLLDAPVRRAHAALREATDEELAECIASPIAGVLTSLIRAAGARVPERSRGATVSKSHADVETELLEAVRLGLRRGLSPNQPALLWAEAEIFTPPLVAAASYDFEFVLELLLAEGADPMQRNSDGSNAIHAAVDRPSALRRLLRVEPRALLFECLAARSRRGRTPFVAALLREPYVLVHFQACDAMVATGGVALSDHDLACIRSAKRGSRLIGVVSRRHPSISHPVVRWHPAWHWSFPAADRHTIRTTVELSRHGHATLQPELWQLIFGMVERGWFDSGSPVAPPPRMKKGGIDLTTV